MGIEHEAAYCEALKRIRLAHQSGTEELCLTDLALERLPEELGELPGLTTLRVDGCVKLRDLSNLRLCTRLTVLDLRGCPQVIDLNPLQGLHTLRELGLGVRDWGAFYRDKELRSELGNIDVLTDLTALETLTLAGCSKISDFQPLTALTALQQLDLSDCRQLQNLSPLAGLTALQSLYLSGCWQLQALPPLAGLAALQHLDLSRCWQLQELLLSDN